MSDFRLRFKPWPDHDVSAHIRMVSLPFAPLVLAAILVAAGLRPVVAQAASPSAGGSGYYSYGGAGGLGDGGGGGGGTATQGANNNGDASSGGSGGDGGHSYSALGFGGAGGAVGATSVGTSSISGGAGQNGQADPSTSYGAGGGGGGGAGAYTSDVEINIVDGQSITGGAGGNSTSGDYIAGGGGGGGAGLAANAANGTIINGGTIAGGAGGNGASGGFGGGGGGGGDGLVLAGSATMLTNTGLITGGAGGNGGNGGGGGGGGAGINMDAPGMVVTNTGTIAGGTGGAGAMGGAGIITDGGATITNASLISGGPTGGASTQADSILFNGTGNLLDLRTGSSLAGNVELAAGAAATIAALNSGLDLGTAVVLDDASSALSFDTSAAALTDSASISGAGSVTETGGGVLMLQGNNTYTGGTIVEGGSTLNIQGDQNLGGAGGSLTLNNGTLQAGAAFTSSRDVVLENAGGIDTNGYDVTLGGTISSNGAGALVKLGDGVLILTGANTYAGGTTMGGGTLSVSADDNLGDAAGGLTFNGGTLQTTSAFTSARTVDLAGSGTVQTDADLSMLGHISGSGALTKTGTGTLILGGTNTYTGGTTISAGTLQGDTASLQGNIANNAALVFQQSASGRYAGVISGSGTLVLQGGGTLIVTGANTYTGGTTVANSTLQLGAGGTSGSIASQSIVLNGSNLVVDRSDSLTYGGVISGTGALTQQGTGTLILNGDSNGFAGTTTVMAGTLEVGDLSHDAAVLGGNVVVSGNGTLMGHGTIGGSVTNTGNLRPGGSIGILHVSGNYTQSSSGTLTIEVTPNVAAGPGVGYDQLAVGGIASLAGTLAVLPDQGTYTVGSRYTVLTAAGGRNGTFSTIAYNPAFAAYITPDVTYDASNVYLSLDPTPSPSGPPKLVNSGQDVPDMLSALGATAAAVGNAVLADVCSPAARRGMVPGAGCEVRDYGVNHLELWLSGLGGFGTVTGSGTQTSFHDSNAGVLLGAGLNRGHLTLGLGVGYAATMLNFSDGSTASQNAALGFAYARYDAGRLHLATMGAYGGGTIDGTRALPGTGVTASGNRDGAFAVIQAQAAYDIPLGHYTLQPRAVLAYLHARQDGFSESGASLLDLTYGGTATDAVQTRLSARVMRDFTLGTWSVLPWAEAGVQEQLSGLDRSVAVVDGVYGTAVSGASPAPTAALVGLGVEASAPRGVDVYLRYQGLFSANATSTAFTAGMGMRF